MRALTAIVVVAIASPADAKAVDSIRSEQDLELGTIEIGKPDRGARVSRVDAKLVVFQARVAMTLSIELAGATADPRDITMPLRLPPGSRPVGMTVQIDRVATPAVLLSATEARTFYDETVKRYRDPGLLEQRGDQLALHVYPVTAKGTQKVELTVLLPRVRRVAIVPATTIARIDVDLEADGTAASRHLSWSYPGSPRRFELPKPALGLAEDPALDRAAVDATHSLVAGGTAAPGVGVPTISIGVHTSSCGGMRWVDKSMIKQRIKLMMPKLTYCYERELYRDKTLAGTVDVRFAIEQDGSAHVLAVDGTLADQVVRSCVANVFEQIEFPRGDTKIIVNYPLTYRSVEY